MKKIALFCVNTDIIVFLNHILNPENAFYKMIACK